MTKFSSLILVLTPLMEAYYFPCTHVNLWKIALIIFCLYIWIKNPVKGHIQWPNKFFPYFIYALLSPFIGALLYSDISIITSSLIVNLIYGASLIIIVPQCNLSYCIKYYRAIVIIASIFFILQELMYHTLGFRFSGLIPFLDVPYDTTTADFISKQTTFDRSSSFFLEPAHFAQYCVGYLAIVLGENCKKNKLITPSAILITVVLFLTVSGNAILLIAVAWFVFFVMYFKKSALKFVLLLPFFIVIGIFTFYQISTTEQGQRLLERTDELEYDSTNRISSGTMRIYRGFFVYDDMPIIFKLTGVGTAATDDAIERSNYFWMFGKDRYINNLQKLLIGNGFIGLILFLIYVFSQIKRTTYEGKILMALFLALSLVEYCWLFPKMLIYCGLAWLFQLCNNNGNVSYCQQVKN